MSAKSAKSVTSTQYTGGPISYKISNIQSNIRDIIIHASPTPHDPRTHTVQWSVPHAHVSA